MPGRTPASASLPWATNREGITNMSQGEVRALCRRLLETDTYRVGFEKRLIAGSLPPALEQMVWNYAYGKPQENINLSVTQGAEDLSQLSIAELQERAAKLADALREARDAQSALDAQPVRVM